MPNKSIDRYVSENRGNLRRIDSELVEVSGGRDTNLSFIRNIIEVTVEIEIYKRSLGGGLISGHPNGQMHGSAHGKSGDFRGSWNFVTDVEVSEEFTINGRNSLRDALSGEKTGKIYKSVIGNGTNTASIGDDSLQNKISEDVSWSQKPSNNEVKSKSIYLFSQHNENVSEFGLVSSNGNLLARITTDAINPTLEEEIRVDINLSFSGEGTGNSVITNTGETIIADSIRREGSNVGIESIEFGSGSNSPSKSDTSLQSPIIEKGASREKSPSEVVAHAYLFSDEPQNQPVNIAELGVKDNNDRLLWRTTVREFEKNSNFKIESFVGFKAQ